jgi:glycogen debranching enzyme
MSNSTDLSRNLVMKEDYAFVVMDADGFIDGGERGIYSHDTRFLRTYLWELGPRFQTLVRHSESPNHYFFYYADIEGPSQCIGVSRDLHLGPTTLEDRLSVENSQDVSAEVTLQLQLDADFIDMFEARGITGYDHGTTVAKVEESALVLRYAREPGTEMQLRVEMLEGPGVEVGPRGLSFTLLLAPREQRRLAVRSVLDSGVPTYQAQYDYASWRKGFPRELTDFARDWKRALVLTRAVDDLRALLLHTPTGPISAAGIPWFVACFGRDALITAYMLLPHHPEVAHATLRALAQMQGTRTDGFRAEEPGKIPHERRHGELTRRGIMPHSPYYGTIDATPLFVVLLGRLYSVEGDPTILRQLRSVWESALSWITECAMQRGPFLRYTGASPGQGLVVQSWKDSDDSMSHADGRLAAGSIAPVEVQGYGYAALRAAATFYRALGEVEAAQRADGRADELAAAVEQRFWLEDLGTYAMGLDGDDRPLKVKSSNAGHLLWSGVPGRDRAERVVKTLFSQELWSGWGIRTLGGSEVRYNPVSYHNGSVWPHDNALIAAGLQRYGFTDEARRIRDVLFDLAESQEDKRLPELIAGYPRRQGPPIPYPVACRPQAWDAAALVFLAGL